MLLACAGKDGAAPAHRFVAVTFNVGTGGATSTDASGYGPEQAEVADAWYGNGLAWLPAIEEAAAWLADVDAAVVGLQEVFDIADCAGIPAEAQVGWVCETLDEDPRTVPERLLGPGWQVACHPGQPDECLAISAAFGTLVGCEDGDCSEALEGFEVEGCGSGARVARATVIATDGSERVLVHLHGSSGVDAESQSCRVAQVEQVFVDLGDGRPGVSGDWNLVLGDLNTDPGRFADWDASAARWNDFVGEGLPFRWLTDVGPDAPGSYGGLADIDHVASDRATGSCTIAGVTEGEPVSAGGWFDHAPWPAPSSPDPSRRATRSFPRPQAPAARPHVSAPPGTPAPAPRCQCAARPQVYDRPGTHPPAHPCHYAARPQVYACSGTPAPTSRCQYAARPAISAPPGTPAPARQCRYAARPQVCALSGTPAPTSRCQTAARPHVYAHSGTR